MIASLVSVIAFMRLLIITTEGAYSTGNVIAHNASKLEDFMFVRTDDSTGARIAPQTNGPNGEQVDCLGLGKTIATALEWFFMSNADGSNAFDVEFQLSSRKQPHRVRVVPGDQFGLEWTDFKIERRTVVIVHGFLTSGQASWIKDMEVAFHHWGNVNVIIVDWSARGNTWNYYKAAVNTQLVGHQLAQFLEQIANTTLEEEGSVNRAWGPLHLVGHSLGAHICGFTAKEFRKKQNKWKIERITGLDPAQPCFKDADRTVKLDKTDAPFVDVIHTNGKLLYEIGFGLPEPIGHMDFYPNGGSSQPGCLSLSPLQQIYPIPIPHQIINRAICSHGRSYVYLTESLHNAVNCNCTFWAQHWNLSHRDLQHLIGKSCDKNTCIEMGINSENYRDRGTFFAATANNSPFCLNGTTVTEEVREQLTIDHAGHLRD